MHLLKKERSSAKVSEFPRTTGLLKNTSSCSSGYVLARCLLWKYLTSLIYNKTSPVVEQIFLWFLYYALAYRVLGAFPLGSNKNSILIKPMLC